MEKIDQPSEEIILPEDIDIENTNQSKADLSPNNMLNDVITSFKNLRNIILDRHHKGQLPIQLLVIVAIYNFVFFQAEDGKEIYVFIPLASAIISYVFKYWEFPTKFKYILSGGALFLGLIWDLIVSISFIPTYKNWGWSYDSAPTLAIDLIALFSAIMWFTNKKKYLPTISQETFTIDSKEV